MTTKPEKSTAEVADEAYTQAEEGDQLPLVSFDKFKPKTVTIPLNALPANSKLASPDPSEELLKSIRQLGVHEPITVIDHGDGTYDVRDGRRRVKACRKLDKEKIIATVWPASLGTVEGLLITVTTNALRSDNALSDIEAFRKLRKDYDVHEPKAIAGLTHMPFGTVQRRLRLMEFFDQEPIFEKAVKAGRLTVSTAELIIPLSRAQRDLLLAKLDADKKAKLTGKDVHEAKRVQVQQGANSLNLPDMNLPTEPVKEKFILLHDIEEPIFLIEHTLAEARSELAHAPTGYTLYKLVAV